MSDGRCRACGAALAPNAAWCSLCFADLREPPPAPEPVPEPAPLPVVAAAPAPVVPRGPVLTASPFVPAPAPAGGAVVTTVSSDAPAVVPPRIGDEPRWPCLHCGVSNPMTENTCGACGAGFLAGAGGTSEIRLPVVGDMRSLSTGQRLALGFAVMAAITLVLVALAAVGGSIF